MGLTNARQHFTNRQQMLFQLELTVRTQALQINQATANTLDTISNELIRLLFEHGIFKQFAVDVRNKFDQLGEIVVPRPVRFCIGEQCINARLAGFLVLQQFVGYTAVGRHHENTLVEIVFATIRNDDVIAHGFVVTH